MRRDTITVDQLMSTALITATTGDSLSAADFEMKLARVRHVPVVDGRGNLVGVVSDRDVLRTASRLGGRPIRVVDAMTPDPITVRADQSAHEALELLITQKIGCLPVEGEDGQLVGILTATDFLELAQSYLIADEARAAARED